MSKTLLAGSAVALILGIQQYQLNRITDEVVQIKDELKFITQVPGALAHFTEKDEACLARNIYYEAGVESEYGKYSVAQVTLNRLKTGRWGKTLCEVIYAKAQFSWTLRKKLPKPSGQAWEDSRWVAHRALRGDEVPSLKNALYYHADYVRPAWRKPDAKISQIGAHIFYAAAKTKLDHKSKG